MNVSTIYRTLELLEQLGLVTHTHLGHGAPRYHLAAEAEHVHLVCPTAEGHRGRAGRGGRWSSALDEQTASRPTSGT